jgi:hypothetical protein
MLRRRRRRSEAYFAVEIVIPKIYLFRKYICSENTFTPPSTERAREEGISVSSMYGVSSVACTFYITYPPLSELRYAKTAVYHA